MAASFKASPFCPPCLTWCNSSLRGRTTCCEATKGHKLVPRYPRTHPLTNHLYYGSLRWSQSRSGTLHAPAKTPEGITAYSHVSSVCKASLAISDHTRPHSSTQRPRCWVCVPQPCCNVFTLLSWRRAGAPKASSVWNIRPFSYKIPRRVITPNRSIY